MKKIASILICIAMLASFALPAVAAECDHADMTEVGMPATCVTRASTVYSCTCGYSSTVYAEPEVNVPDDGLHFTVESDSDGDTMTLTVTSYNNPGLYASRFRIYFNPEALTAVDVSNGEVWSSSGALFSKSENRVTFYADTTGSDNTKSGVVFTAEFKVLGAAENWDLDVKIESGDIINSSAQRVPYTVEVTAEEGYGGHNAVIRGMTDATCMQRASAMYECVDCGYSYEKAISPDVQIPDGLVFLMQGELEGDTLTVTVTNHNNPGIFATRLIIGYNSAYATPVSAENGEVWPGGLAQINDGNIKFFADGEGNNTNNGVIMTATFKVSGSAEDWGISLTINRADIIDFNSNWVSFTKLVTVADGYAEHIYDAGVVTLEPTFDTEGLKVYTCSVCGHTHEEILPVIERYTKGDVNGSGNVNISDLFDLKGLLLGAVPMDAAKEYAADVSGDGTVNITDLFALKEMLI